ncbi:hypothetical protein FS837_004036 [Tulasnella sp. UAMH 9824]|nr:hypothetical protein FS837_004036 [Tulasnella sp. UAMH 9824]
MAQLPEPQPTTPTTVNPDPATSQPRPDHSRPQTPIDVPSEPTVVYPEQSDGDPPLPQVPVQGDGPPRGEPRASPRPAQAPVRPTDVATAASIAAAWPTKRINWPPGSDSTSLIIMQAKNGPCSLIALCNVLILRGDMTILPSDRKSVSYEYLAQLIADYLVSRTSDDAAIEGLSAALSKLPDLQEGMDINSVWTSSSSFKQLGEGGELKLFHLCGVELVHGWLADPSSQEYEALIKVEDYDGALNKVVAADTLTHGRLVESDQPGKPHHQATLDLTEEQQALVKDDSVFTREPAVCWETLEDVDGSASMFVDAHLVRSSTAGGDYSGRSAEAAVRDAERAMEDLALDSDAALARQLQAEEDAAARARHAERAARRGEQAGWEDGGYDRDQRYPGRIPQRRSDMPPELQQRKKKGGNDCVIM